MSSHNVTSMPQCAMDAHGGNKAGAQEQGETTCVFDAVQQRRKFAQEVRILARCANARGSQATSPRTSLTKAVTLTSLDGTGFHQHDSQVGVGRRGSEGDRGGPENRQEQVFERPAARTQRVEVGSKTTKFTRKRQVTVAAQRLRSTTKENGTHTRQLGGGVPPDAANKAHH